MAAPVHSLPPIVVALAGWLVPGAAHWLIGRRRRGYVVGCTVLSLFLVGLLVAGVRVIQVPGYNFNGQRVLLNDEWQLTARPFATVISQPWFLGQILAGPVTLVSAWASLEVADTWRVEGYTPAGETRTVLVDGGTEDLALAAAADRGVRATAIEQAYPRTHAPLAGVGTIYTAVAGMLNLLAIIDATGRAARGDAAEPAFEPLEPAEPEPAEPAPAASSESSESSESAGQPATLSERPA